jgi:hypothetical protein
VLGPNTVITALQGEKILNTLVREEARANSRHNELLERLDELRVSVLGPQREATAVFTGSPIKAVNVLFNIYPHLHNTLSQIAEGSEPELSSEDALWLQLEFDGLLRDAVRAAYGEMTAKPSRGAQNPISTALANPNHELMCSHAVPLPRQQSRIADRSAGFVLHGPDRVEKDGAANQMVLNVSLPTGKLSIGVTKGQQIELGQRRQKFTRARVSFVPNTAWWHLSGITAIFMRDFETKRAIKPALSIFSIQPEQSPIFPYIASGNLMKVREMLVTGRASAYDRDPNGNSLLTV